MMNTRIREDRRQRKVWELIENEFLPLVRFTVNDIYMHDSQPGDLDIYAVLKQMEFEKKVQKVVRLYSDKDHTTMVYCLFTPKAADGYRSCHCRDCFNGTIGPAGELCDGCEKADCDPRKECTNPHAYGGLDGSGHCGDVDCCGEPYEESN